MRLIARIDQYRGQVYRTVVQGWVGDQTGFVPSGGGEEITRAVGLVALLEEGVGIGG